MFGLSSLSIALLALSSAANGSPTRRAMAIHDERGAAPDTFVKAEPAAMDTTLNFRIGITPKDIDGLEKATLAVSEPDSALYGQHLSFDESTHELLGQSFRSTNTRECGSGDRMAIDNGISDVKTSGAFDDWLTFTIPVSQASSLLDANFDNFVHTPTGERVIRTLAYSIPADLLPHIEVVHPTTSFAKQRFGGPTPIMSIPIPGASNITDRALPAPASCASTVTPACLEALYGIPTTRATQSSNRLGVSGFIDQFANNFLGALRPDMSSATTFTLQTLDGGQNPQGANQAGIEANLDIQYTVGVATGVPTVFVSVGDRTTDGVDGFLDIINFLNAQSAPPQVLTTSYGFDETDLPAATATRLCNAYMALGARGVSILFASGDGGVSGGQSQSCTTFIPAFPGGCAFHTSVGATRGINPEVAATFSSGGFSRVFTRPSFQDAAVTSYLAALGNTNSGRFNAAGRAFPDIAAQGQNVEIVVGGQAGLVAGTSCSSPIFASVISLINDRLVAAGRPVLGFLNPFLYANPQAFFDITSGNNPGCGTNGFPARAGCESFFRFRVTGLGTPNFAAMLSAAGL
ncbi:family S53 protease [Mucidula mucida]|nr:family S53 protease [Mucidula mucida]